MARKTKIPEFATVIGKILADYQDGVVLSVEEATKKVGQAGVRELKNTSRDIFGESDREKVYARGWGVELRTTRVGSQAIIWNKTNPGLVHLLENGHAVRRGGRTVGQYAGKAHVYDVNQKIQEEYIREVASAISRN